MARPDPRQSRYWLAPALVLVCWLGLTPPAPPQDVAPARVPSQGVHALSAKAYQAWLDRMKKEGYRPTQVSAYGTGVPQFAGVAIKDGKMYPWQARQGLTEAKYRKFCDDWYKTGYRVLSVSGYRENNATHFAAVWVKDGITAWQAKHGLTEPQYRQACADFQKKGYWVISVSGYPEGNGTRFAAVWVLDKARVSVARHHLTEQQYLQMFTEFQPKGYRPDCVSVYPVGKETRFAVVFAKGAKDFFWGSRHNLTQAQYQSEFDLWTKQGGRPLLVCGYAVGKETRYVGVFIADAATGEALVGKWSPVSPWPIVAIHAAVLPNGKVLAWTILEDPGPFAGYGGGKEKVPTVPKKPPEKGYPHVWDPDHPIVLSPTAKPNEKPNLLTPTAKPPHNPFCSGHAFLPDGRLFIAGGHRWANYWGDERVTIYDPRTGKWATGLPPMKNRRWYPSCVTLASGDILVDGGTWYYEKVANQDTWKVNRLPQIWQTKSNTWRDLTGIQDDDYNTTLVPFYPFLHAAPNGKVFRSGPNVLTGYIKTDGTGKWEPLAYRHGKERDYGSSVMFDKGMVLVVGGGYEPTETAEVINLNDAKPTWRLVEPMSAKRRHMNATLLADGTVFVSGGTSATGINNAAGRVWRTEIWDPHTGHWTQTAPQSETRIYHSIALLLPDGRVLSAGGGEPPGDGKDARGNPLDKNHLNAQIFWPPYLFRGPRPVITGAPASVKYGQQFAVKTPDAAHIHNVKFIRLGSATHARNFDQRINHLVARAQGNTLIITAPPNANEAPPGYYMLFILSDRGVPSVAKIIRIG